MTDFSSVISSAGNRIMGNKAVTGIGTASLIHQISINAITAMTFQPYSPIGSGAGTLSNTANNAIPVPKNASFLSIEMFYIIRNDFAISQR